MRARGDAIARSRCARRNPPGRRRRCDRVVWDHLRRFDPEIPITSSLSLVYDCASRECAASRRRFRMTSLGGGRRRHGRSPRRDVRDKLLMILRCGKRTSSVFEPRVTTSIYSMPRLRPDDVSTRIGTARSSFAERQQRGVAADSGGVDRDRLLVAERGDSAGRPPSGRCLTGRSHRRAGRRPRRRSCSGSRTRCRRARGPRCAARRCRCACGCRA